MGHLVFYMATVPKKTNIKYSNTHKRLKYVSKYLPLEIVLKEVFQSFQKCVFSI